MLARKPVVGTVADNFEAWGTGGLNIDASRIGSESVTINSFDNGAKPFGGAVGEPFTSRQSVGRWPANVVFDEVTAGILDEQSGVLKSGKVKPGTIRAMKSAASVSFADIAGGSELWGYGDEGGASRFFYVAKASKRDRNEGLEDVAPVSAGEMVNRVEGSAGMNSPRAGAGRTAGSQNFHPTVKPTALMRYLVKLVTPPGGVVLDPFTGSGSTGKAAILEGFGFVGAELTADYLPIIEGRLRWALENREETLF